MEMACSGHVALVLWYHQCKGYICAALCAGRYVCSRASCMLTKCHKLYCPTFNLRPGQSVVLGVLV